jgi:hypothetical protein
MTFWIKLVNKLPTSVGAFAIAFDQNWAGINPVQQPEWPDALDFGDSVEMGIPLIYSERFYRASDANVLRVAVRSSIETKTFVTQIDAAAVLQDSAALTDAQLKQAWGAYSAEIQVDIDGTLPPDDVFAARKVRLINRSGPLGTVAFVLPPANIYIAKVREANKRIFTVVHGNPALFEMIKSSAEAIFAQ